MYLARSVDPKGTSVTSVTLRLSWNAPFVHVCIFDVDTLYFVRFSTIVPLSSLWAIVV